MNDIQIIALLAAALILLAAVFAAGLRLLRSQSADAFKNSLELVKVASLVIVAGFTFIFIDRHQQDLSAAEHNLKVYQTFFEASSATDPHVRLHALRNIDVYRQSFLVAGSHLDNALVALSKGLLEDSSIQVLLVAPENSNLVDSLESDRSPILRRSLTTLEDVLGPLYSLSDIEVEQWKERQMVALRLPFSIPLAWDKSTTIATIRVHRRAAPFFRRVFDDIRDLGLQSSITDFGGAYNFRRLRGTTRLSSHAYGVAIDLNASSNPLGSRGDMDPRLVGVFKKNGFLWGGDFPSRPDPMHFEVDPLLLSQETKTPGRGS